MALSATVFEILTHKARKSLNFHTPPFFEAPFGGTPKNFVMKFGVRKLESWGYQKVKQESRAAARKPRDAASILFG